MNRNSVFLFEATSDDLYECLLDLTMETGENLSKAAWVTIKKRPSERILSYIKSLGVTNMADYEKFVESENLNESLRYYEKEKRFDEALTIISDKKFTYDSTIFDFYKSNKAEIPEPAQQFFLDRIDKNIESTGDHYYAIIAETIAQLKQINTSLAEEILEDIRTNYKRRTKLMSMLGRF